MYVVPGIGERVFGVDVIERGGSWQLAVSSLRTAGEVLGAGDL